VPASLQILHQASDAIVTADLSHTIVMASPAAARLFGTSVADMLGSPLGRWLELAGGPGALLRSGSGRAGRRGTDYTIVGRHSDGRRFPIEGSVARPDHGAPFYTVVMRDVSQRRMVQEKLRRSHDQLRQLSAALQTIREEERKYIARELHDDLGQMLASLRMDLVLLQQAAGMPSSSLQLMQGMEANLLSAIASLRRIASNLRPRALDEGGLFFALQGLREEFVRRYGLPCLLLADEADLCLDDGTSTAIFRIVQEALTNIARHAGATEVTMNLLRIDHDLLLTIQDDGRGIRPEDMDKAESLGLVGMRERVWAMKGEITILGEDGPGTRIEIVVPLSDYPG
jgi:PAS domain S-box-containing protein